MNKPLLIAAASLCAIAANASSVTYNSKTTFTSSANVSVLDTFEAAGPKNTALPSLTSQGITYTGQAGTPFPNVYVAAPGFNNFGAGVGTTTTSVLTANGDENFLAAVIASSYTAIGFDVYLNGLGPASVQFFNGTTSLGIVSFATGNDIQFAGITADVPITSFHFVSTRGGELNTGIDNVLAGSAVPDGGATALLFGVGVLGLGLFRRRDA